MVLLRRLRLTLVLFGVMSVASLEMGFMSHVASASNSMLFVATNGSDTGNNCSNQGAPCATISHAVSQAGSNDTISVAAGTYHETVTVPSSASLSIAGAGATATRVDGMAAGSVFTVNGGAPVTLTGLAVPNGPSTAGAGIVNIGTMTLDDDIISANTASNSGSAAPGGGIANVGTMTLIDDTISGNSVLSDNSTAIAGGVYNVNTMTITNSVISNNRAASITGNSLGGGLANLANLTLTNDTISGNSVPVGPNAGGGGIISAGPSLIVTSDTISGNSAGAGQGGGLGAQGGSVSFSGGPLANHSR